MPKLPTVAIIGRPNTGKSTLFNSLLKRRVAIVSDVPGTTRDHIARKVNEAEIPYLLLDTGGMGGGTRDKEFEEDVHEQSLLALRYADLIIFTVNAREELTKSDHEIVQTLRTSRRRHVPVLLVATKCDNQNLSEEAEGIFAELGLHDDIIPISAISNIGTRDVREAITRELKKLHFGVESPTQEPSEIPRVAVIGKPNVGKSSIVNALMSDTQREVSPRLVSDIPGTTRDSTDTIIRSKDRDYLFIDTAGLRKQARVEEDLEHEAYMRTILVLEEADVAVLVLDATEVCSKQDKHIAGLAIDEGKGLILLLNKFDLLSTEQREQKKEEVAYAFPFCRYAPVLTTSAVTREHLPKLFDLISMVHRNRQRRFPIKELHEWMQEQLMGKPMGALATAKHITQSKDIPPTFILFVKNPKQVRVSQLRYLDNRLRETFGLEGTPVRWITKGPGDRITE
ncbi:MAG: ribosome biogenesis GTPase Der [Candidatus Peribacteraceae bacterium]